MEVVLGIRVKELIVLLEIGIEEILKVVLILFVLLEEISEVFHLIRV